jgi:hypothetical protein
MEHYRSEVVNLLGWALFSVAVFAALTPLLRTFAFGSEPFDQLPSIICSGR